MNKIALIYIIISVFSIQCKKYDIQPSSNIVLHDKPLRVIRVNIQGSWKLCYEQGGICMLCPPNIKVDEFYEFYDDWVIWTYKNEKISFFKDYLEI
jgi:hypothetical protein